MNERMKNKMCRHPNFDPLIMGFIIANTVVMSLSSFGMEDDFRFSLEVLNFLFAMVFNFECVVKLIGLKEKCFYDKIGSRRVFNNWNIFDFLVRSFDGHSLKNQSSVHRPLHAWSCMHFGWITPIDLRCFFFV